MHINMLKKLITFGILYNDKNHVNAKYVLIIHNQMTFLFDKNRHVQQSEWQILRLTRMMLLNLTESCIFFDWHNEEESGGKVKMWLWWQNVEWCDTIGVCYPKKIHVTFVKSCYRWDRRRKNETRLPNNVKNISFALFVIPSKCNAYYETRIVHFS